MSLSNFSFLLLFPGNRTTLSWHEPLQNRCSNNSSNNSSSSEERKLRAAAGRWTAARCNNATNNIECSIAPQIRLSLLFLFLSLFLLFIYTSELSEALLKTPWDNFIHQIKKAFYIDYHHHLLYAMHKYSLDACTRHISAARAAAKSLSSCLVFVISNWSSSSMSMAPMS